MRRARVRARRAVAALDALGERVDVVGRGAAAAADDVHAVAFDELAEHVGDLLRRLGEDRLAVRALVGDAGVGDAVDRHRRVLAEEADGISHVLGAGRAVEADDVDLQRLERGERGADVRAEQHLAAVGQEADAGLDRDAAAGGLERLARAEDGRLDLQDVLRGLDDDEVDAAFEQALGLLGEDGHELAESDPAEGRVLGRRQVAGGADRAGHEAVLADRVARDLGGLAVDLQRMVGQAPLLELDPGGLEGVGLDDLGARLDHRLVDALDDVGPVEHEGLVATAGKPVVVFEREVELLERGAHPAVEEDDAVAHGGEEVTHGCGWYRNLDTTLARFALTTLRHMVTFIVVAVVLVVVAIAVVARRSARREPRPEAWEGHRAAEADHHWSRGSHGSGGYGGGGGEAGPGGRAGP
jgi:hypothetical protein